MADSSRRVLVAVGGNSLIRAGQKGTIAEQFANARLASESIADLIANGYQVIVTHGNGPQVGAQLLRTESGSAHTYPLPLDVCVATTQGEIGYLLQNSLQSVLRGRKLRADVTTIVTQVLVDKTDPAFGRPTKPIGPFYSEEAARKKEQELGWNVVEDAARGYRRVVASPKPLRIIEVDTIKHCVEQGTVVISAGGGGIPVVEDDGQLRGVEAVIDKDRASSLLAAQLGVPLFVISTDVRQVFIRYKKPDQEMLGHISADAARSHVSEGHFAEGSMRPKMEAAIDFVMAGGKEAIITDPEHLVEAVEKGTSGTHITMKGKG